MKYRSGLLHAALAILLFLPVPAMATEAGWALLREGGQVVLVNEAYSLATGRHASEDIENCRTQQTLSDRGRQQAGKMGALFYARSAPVELVLTSKHCRAQETASIAFRDSKIEVFEPLNELSADEELQAHQIEATISRIQEYGGSGNLIMVSHPSNIAALTGVTPRPGEAIVVMPADNKLTIAARITFN
ncbi:histidine phosphatase family protein [Nitratireductor aestuarii]|uniref:histidine phosphatase family protein n=1 Tax=Nitratireductor aestuarii TaxID=1735103 RepID=UPI00166EE703|nr:histidine phosphatase family protein [Nitratireductor aestuarii]